MSEEVRLKILSMVNDGKLTAEEASEMIQMLSADKAKAEAKSADTTADAAAEPEYVDPLSALTEPFKQFLPKKVDEESPSRKLKIKFNGRAVKEGPVEFTLSLGFLKTLRWFVNLIPGARRVIMWDTFNLIGGELMDIRVSVD